MAIKSSKKNKKSQNEHLWLLCNFVCKTIDSIWCYQIFALKACRWTYKMTTRTTKHHQIQCKSTTCCVMSGVCVRCARIYVCSCVHNNICYDDDYCDDNVDGCFTSFTSKSILYFGAYNTYGTLIFETFCLTFELLNF